MNNLPTSTQTLENLKSELARAEAEYRRHLMGHALGPIRAWRNISERLREAVAEREKNAEVELTREQQRAREAVAEAWVDEHEEAKRQNYALRTNWHGDLDCQRLANEAMSRF